MRLTEILPCIFGSILVLVLISACATQGDAGFVADSEEPFFRNYNDGKAGYCIVPEPDRLAVTPLPEKGDCPDLNFIYEEKHPLQFYRLLNILRLYSESGCYPYCYETTLHLEKKLVLQNVKGTMLYDSLTGETTSRVLQQLRPSRDTIELTFCTGDRNSIVLIKNVSCNLIVYPTRISYAQFQAAELERNKSGTVKKICYMPDKARVSWNTDSCSHIPGAFELLYDPVKSNSNHSIFRFVPLEPDS